MEVMHKRVAGLDVHKTTVVACVRIQAGRKVPTPGDAGNPTDETAEAIPIIYNQRSTLKADITS